MPQILKWVIVWFIIWCSYNRVFKEKKITNRGQLIISLFFLTSFILTAILFKLSSILLILLSIPLIVAITISIIVFVSQNKGLLHLKHKPTLYLFATSFNVLYQQTMIFILVDLISNFISNNLYTVLFLGFFFGLVHSPVLLMKEIKIRKEVFTLSIFAGAVFAFIMLNFKFGIIYSFILHFSFYIYKSFTLKDEATI